MKGKATDRLDRGAGIDPEGRPPAPHWRPATRAAFRFCLVYLGLFALATQVAGSLFLIPTGSFRGFGQLWPMREITLWTASRVFGALSPLDFSGANGESLFFWVQTFWILVLAIVATGVWTVLDRRRAHYVAAHKWFRLFVRLGLASQMLEYGMTKVIPTQFAAPSLNVLVTPTGELPLNTLLWTSIGAAPAYQIFTGCAELLGGILLLIPRTTMAGALVSLADLVQVFVLNMTYDVGLKLTSLHLILLALFLLAPDFRRLARFLFLNQATGASTGPPLFRAARANRIALALQILFGLYLLGTYAYLNVGYWYAAGGGAPRSPLYGVWDVERLWVDGETGPPSLNDYDRRWRRVIFDAPDRMAFQRTDDSFARYGALVDVGNSTLSLTKGDSREWKSEFVFRRPADNRVILEGEMDGYEIYAELERVEFDTFRLLNSHFRWVRPDAP